MGEDIDTRQDVTLSLAGESRFHLGALPHVERRVQYPPLLPAAAMNRWPALRAARIASTIA